MPVDMYLSPGPQDEAWARQHREFLELVVRHVLTDGAWPDVRGLQRDLASLEPGVEVEALARDMPRELGTFDSETHQLSLNFYGLAFCNASSGLRFSIWKAAAAAWTIYSDSSRPACLRRDNLRELGLDGPQLTAVSRLLFNEPGFFKPDDPPINPAADWERDLSDDVRHFAAVKDEGSYLGVRTELAYPAGQPLDGRGAISVTGQRRFQRRAVLALGDLHPLIGVAAVKYINDGYYGEAVQQAYLAFRDELRSRTGSTLDGDVLVGHAFGGATPKIVVADLATDTGRNIQKGTRLMAEGLVASVRNPHVHDPVDLDVIQALELLSTLSALSRRLP